MSDHRNQGYDHVLTISNEIAANADAHPTAGLKVRSISKVSVSDLSWTALLTTAQTLKRHKGVDAPSRRSCSMSSSVTSSIPPPALSFEDMGSNWTAVRDAVRNVGATPSTDGVDEVCSRWDQLLRTAR